MSANRFLTEDIKLWARGLGAKLVGIASADKFEGAPEGFHPHMRRGISNWEKIIKNLPIMTMMMEGGDKKGRMTFVLGRLSQRPFSNTPTLEGGSAARDKDT